MAYYISELYNKNEQNSSAVLMFWLFSLLRNTKWYSGCSGIRQSTDVVALNIHYAEIVMIQVDRIADVVFELNYKYRASWI